MPKHRSKETVTDSSSASGSASESEEEKTPPPPKKQKKEKKEKKKEKKKEEDEEEHKYLIGNKRFVTVRDFRNKLLIDIREFYEADGELKPGKKGISLTVEQWRKLESKIEDINESIQDLS